MLTPERRAEIKARCASMMTHRPYYTDKIDHFITDSLIDLPDYEHALCEAEAATASIRSATIAECRQKWLELSSDDWAKWIQAQHEFYTKAYQGD